MQAALTLGDMGDRSGPVVSALTALLCDPDPAISGNARSALIKLGVLNNSGGEQRFQEPLFDPPRSDAGEVPGDLMPGD